MVKKKEDEAVSKESLFMILDLLDGLNMRYWVDGGWGVDVLVGRQSRAHRDVDINFDADFEGVLIDKLLELGYEIRTDWRPSRLELFHPQHGYIDVHPLQINDSGDARQANPEGGWYELKAEWFSSACFEGRLVPCISVEAQRLFHSGYELRETDKADLEILNQCFPHVQCKS